jgi:hypothetical protein
LSQHKKSRAAELLHGFSTYTHLEMKKICFSLCACMATALAMAQPILNIVPDSIEVSFESSLTDEFEEYKASTYFSNASEETLAIRWQLLFPDEDCPEAWKFAVGDNNLHFPFGVTSNINIGSHPNIPVNLSPNDTGYFELYVRPNFTAGCCKVKIRYSQLNELYEEIAILDSTSVYVCISDSTISSTHIEQIKASVAAPNPTTSMFKLLGDLIAKEIWVFNVLGAPVLKSVYQPDQLFDLSMFPNGLYTVCALSEQGGLKHITRLIKLAEMP